MESSLVVLQGLDMLAGSRPPPFGKIEDGQAVYVFNARRLSRAPQNQLRNRLAKRKVTTSSVLYGNGSNVIIQCYCCPHAYIMHIFCNRYNILQSSPLNCTCRACHLALVFD